MNIHLVTDEFSLGGGIEHIYQVAKGLTEIKFRIFAQPGNAVKKFQHLENVEIHDKGYHPSYVMEKKSNLVHFHHLRPLLSFFRNPMGRGKYNVPIVFTAHGLHIHKYEFYNSIRGKINYFLRFHLEKWLLSKADRIIAVSREDKGFLEEKYHLKNVSYLTNGIDFSALNAGSRASQNKADLRRKLDLPMDDFLFVTVARFNFQKGYDILIKAISLVKDTIKKHKCRFIFVGDGSEFERVKLLSQNLSVYEYIIFLGARTDVYDILKAGDVSLLPSRWEGLPIILLETGLLKIPVIASNTYGNREIIKEKNGILFKNLDSEALATVIQDVLENKYDLDVYSENLYNEIHKNYNLEKMLTGLRHIYSSYQKEEL
jgi:glycosyltransferase involved in cell wall biosynthesis